MTSIDQQLGRILETWITRDIPDRFCQFCNYEIEDPDRDEFCSEECQQRFDKVVEARAVIGKRDMEHRGYD